MLIPTRLFVWGQPDNQPLSVPSWATEDVALLFPEPALGNRIDHIGLPRTPLCVHTPILTQLDGDPSTLEARESKQCDVAWHPTHHAQGILQIRATISISIDRSATDPSTELSRTIL
jgi:hypothetical protein